MLVAPPHSHLSLDNQKHYLHNLPNVPWWVNSPDWEPLIKPYISVYTIFHSISLFRKNSLASRSLHFNSKKNAKVLKCYCILLRRASKLQIRWVLFTTDLPSLPPNLHLSNCTNSSKHWSFSQLLCYLELNVFHTISSGITPPGFLSLPNCFVTSTKLLNFLMSLFS